MSLWAQVSPSGTVLAHCSSGGGSAAASSTVALRDAATGRWRHTLASPSTGSGSGGASPAIRKLAFAGDDHLVAWRRDGGVTVWDAARGAVASRIAADGGGGSGLTVWDVATTTTSGGGGGPLVLLAVTKANHRKIVLHEYAAATGRLLRKIKGAGKVVNSDEGAAAAVQLAVTDRHFVVRSAGSVRVLARETASKVSKLSLESGSSSSSSSSAAGAGNDNMLLVQEDLGCVLDSSSGKVVLFRASTGKILQPAGGSPALTLEVKNPDCDTLNQLVQDSGNENVFWLLRGDALLATIELHDNNKYSARTRSVDAASGAMDRVCLVLLPTPHCRILAVQIGSSGHNDCKVQHVELPASDGETGKSLKIAWKSETKDSGSSNDDKSRKRGATTVLGPGQVGGEARGVTEAISSSSSNKRSKVVAAVDANDNQDDEDEDEDDSGPTLAERLKQLQEAMDLEDADDEQNDDSRMQTEDDGDDEEEDKFVPQQATTESLTQLLQQSLQSGDSAMLEMALQVRDPVILSQSCRQLEPTHIQSLVVALTTRLALKPARADHLCRWLTAVLQSSSSMDSVEHLQSLQNLLQERLEVFPMLLQLEGRLARMAED